MERSHLFLMTVTLCCLGPISVFAATSTSIPSNFEYMCDQYGELTINKTGLPVDITVLDTNQECSGGSNDTLTTFVLHDCPQNKTFTIAMELHSDKNIIGGQKHKFFDIKCEKNLVAPYLVTAVMAGVTVKEGTSSHFGVHMMTPTTAAPQTITMTITDSKSNSATDTLKEAVLGQNLTVWIQKPAAGYNIKPTECVAKGNNLDHELWTEKNSCQYDEELFGGKWENATGYVKNTMYAFRFVGASTHVSVTCTVRVCPPGYNGDQCELTKCVSPTPTPSGRRRRDVQDDLNNADVQLATAETSLDVVNTIPKVNHAQGLVPSMAVLFLLPTFLMTNLMF